MVLSLAPANVKSHAVAAALTSALDGVVDDETQGCVSFDGRGVAPAEDLTLEAQKAFTQAHLAWLAIETAHREAARFRFELLEAVDRMGVTKWNFRTGAMDATGGGLIRPPDVHATLLKSMGLSFGHLSNQNPVPLDALIR